MFVHRENKEQGLSGGPD